MIECAKLPMGNTVKSDQPGLRTEPTLFEKMKSLFDIMKDKQIFAFLRNPMQPSKGLNNVKQVANARHRYKLEKLAEKGKGKTKVGNFSDEVRATDDELWDGFGGLIKEISKTHKNKPPVYIIYEDWMMDDMLKHCVTNSTNPSILSVDRTFK